MKEILYHNVFIHFMAYNFTTLGMVAHQNGGGYPLVLLCGDDLVAVPPGKNQSLQADLTL